MADQARNLESILAALAGKGATSTPPQGQPSIPPPSYPPQPQPGYQAPAYQQPPASYPYPQPTSSGSLDLSSIQQGGAGNVSIQDAIARAKAHAAQNGVTPYDRPITYGSHPRPVESGRYRTSRSRSRSPTSRRDAYRDNYNPYRDERRNERGGRDYDRDRSFSPRGRDRNHGTFSPRGGNGRPRSPPRGGDDNVETIQIESSLVGLIIGRQGENLRRVEADSQCRVQFLPAASSDDQHRQCKITGPPARRDEAKAMINRIIEDSGMGAIARAGLDRGGRDGGRDSGRGGAQMPVSVTAGQDATQEPEESTQIMVPDRTVGLIIGRGGETIRDLQERSGCHINIVGESKSINGLRPVNLIGSRQASSMAKELIMEIVDSDSRNVANNSNSNPNQQSRSNQRDSGLGGGGPDKINDSIYVPSEAVGMIIGKGGETIREMQNQTGCKINVSQSSGPGEVEREIGLVGSRDAINRAKSAIEDKVEAVRQKNNSGGGGGGGGGRGGRGQHRDYDNPNYGQQQSNSRQPASNPPAMQPPAAAGGGDDPYAAYGGYNAYVALWYQALAQQAQGDAPKPPGTS